MHFDPGWIVLVKRTPEHAALIAAEEYVYLVPYKDADDYASLGERPAEADAAYAREVERCLARQPGNAFCHSAAEALARARR